MKYTFYSLFLVFFIYSFLGYLVESTCVSFNKKKIIVSRGFLIGPYLPIFGFGGLLMTLTLEKYRDDLLALFIISMVICLSIEYFSSYILEKLFKLRWWDYSKKHFNLNGRICLDVGLMFGIPFSGIEVIEQSVDESDEQRHGAVGCCLQIHYQMLGIYYLL